MGPHQPPPPPLPPQELGPSVALMARVTNRRFSGDMGDTSSAAFRSFADEFSRTVSTPAS